MAIYVKSHRRGKSIVKAYSRALINRSNASGFAVSSLAFKVRNEAIALQMSARAELKIKYDKGLRPGRSGGFDAFMLRTQKRARRRG